MRDAAFYKVLDKNKVRCNLCPHLCVIEEDERGLCGVRKNLEGHLKSENYGLVSAIQFDPIEKKPLYHFYPGHSILSFGSIGCNLTCNFCQNCDISQTTVDDYPWLNRYTVEQILNIAQSEDNNIGIAFTYNEPTIYYEFMVDIAQQIKRAHMKNIMISNGYITREPLVKIMDLIDAFNIDLKSFNIGFYKELAGARLQPVMDTLKQIAQAGKHLEITNLVIPTKNDDIDEFEKMLAWIRDELGPETVLHLSRYFPAYQMTIHATPPETLKRLYDKACSYLPYSYMGNINAENGSNTYCPNCSSKVIERSGYKVKKAGLDQSGKCANCGHPVLNYFDR